MGSDRAPSRLASVPFSRDSSGERNNAEGAQHWTFLLAILLWLFGDATTAAFAGSSDDTRHPLSPIPALASSRSSGVVVTASRCPTPTIVDVAHGDAAVVRRLCLASKLQRV